jgi:hypothetical protein
MATTLLPLLVIACLQGVLFTASAAHAQTVYRSVQEDGVVSFSDAPPEAGDAEVIVIDTPPPAQDEILEERLAAMRETTDRMAEDRRERERHRAELRALRAPQESPAPRTESPAPPAYAYWPVARPPLWRPRPPLRPHPVPRPHPMQPAEAPPGWSVMKPGNSQLMRPVVSRRPFRQ